MVKILLGSSLLLNGLLLAVLVAVGLRFKLLEKVERVLLDEGRIPVLKPAHELNRNYVVYREKFATYNDKDRPVLVLGDSHTAQLDWGAMVGEVRVAARGIPGDTSSGLLARLPDYASAKPETAVVWIGTNDLMAGIPPQQIAANIDQTILALKAQEIPRVVVLGVVPFARWIEDGESLNAQVSTINTALESACSAHGATFLDPGEVLRDEQGFLCKTKTSDGIHLNVRGYQAILEILGL